MNHSAGTAVEHELIDNPPTTSTKSFMMGTSHGDFIKYPRTPHLFGSKGTDDDKHLGESESNEFIADESLIVEEKIDGTNVGIHFSDVGQLVLQCRGHLITEGMHAQYDLFKQWAIVKRYVLEERLGNRFILFGEWVYGPRGGIRVNDQLQTSDPDIYAVGDAIEVEDFVLKTPTQVPLAGPANRQGRIAADNIFGRSSRYRGTQGTAILGLFNLTAAMTGASEKVLKRNEVAHRLVYVHPTDHAGYYPDAEQMTLKVLFDPESGKLLGAQGVGGSGVDKRIDVLAVAIQAGMTVFDLEEVELAYAPQFGSAKDPINMVGFVAAGLLRDDHPQIDVTTLLETPSGERPFLLDVRTVEEFDAGRIPDSVNIPVDELRSRLGELPKDRKIAAYCKVGQRGYLATRILRQSGLPAMNVSGGYMTYRLHYPESAEKEGCGKLDVPTF